MSSRRGWACRLMGCRWEFGSRAELVVWRCPRCGGEGARRCSDASAARRVAEACGRGAPRPPLGLLAALGGGSHRAGRRTGTSDASREAAQTPAAR